MLPCIRNTPLLSGDKPCPERSFPSEKEVKKWQASISEKVVQLSQMRAGLDREIEKLKDAGWKKDSGYGNRWTHIKNGHTPVSKEEALRIQRNWEDDLV
jgi:hypothetical protein